MKPSPFKEQIIGILRKQEAGEDGLRVPQTRDKQRSPLQMKGPNTADWKCPTPRLKALQDENTRS
uniref:Uncharacterized protein n=1 Tax=Bradyrhizobium barranii subsp. barranii TaxID=2823807 RepID=A0A7Z0QMR2_9BRAD|nr:hypothetical protein [Bradyrhizobium barranii]